MATKLKMILVQNDIKQGEFAKLIKVSPAALSLILNGRTEPTLRVALKIAKALDTTVEELWGHLIEENENQPD